MRRKLFAALPLAAITWVLLAAPGARGNINIQFDYTYDTGGFFTSNPQAVTLLNDAAQFFDSHITDTLSAINATAQSLSDNVSDTWTTNAFNPSDPGNSSANIQVANLSIPANTIIVYVGGSATLPGSELGYGGFGGYNDFGTQAWLDTVAARGQTGALAGTPTDFGPWGGSIAFSNSANWYFDPDPSTKDAPAGKFDFYTVALHELGHVLGFGTAPSWQALVSGGNFTGANSEALNGGSPVVLSPDLSHWAEGTTSDIFDTATSQEVVMEPVLLDGTEKYFTDLDMAGLQDVGWNVVPEPTAWPWLATSAVLGVHTWRRRRLGLERDQHAVAGSV